MSWKNIWNDGPRSVEVERRQNSSLVKHWINAGLFLEKLFGDYGCGMTALEAYLSENPEVTADYVAERLAGYMSEDTARRKLDAMVKAGVLTRRKAGRTHFYKLDADIAENALSFMKGGVVRMPTDFRLQNAVNSVR